MRSVLHSIILSENLEKLRSVPIDFSSKPQFKFVIKNQEVGNFIFPGRKNFQANISERCLGTRLISKMADVFLVDHGSWLVSISVA